LALLFSASCSYSNWNYGTTGNAAGLGLNWAMPNLFPEANNLSVNGVFYQYTPIKNTADDMKVHVQNEDAINGGYIFRETDDWSGRPGGTPINKVIGVANIPQELWGDGSIAIEGIGTVEDASVIYSYKYDNTCVTPLADPSCPGYAEALLSTINSIPTPVVYDALDDENVQDALNNKTEIKEEDTEEKSEEEEEEIDLENLLSEIDTIVMSATALAQNQLMKAMTLSVNVDSYYNKKIQGGVYKETQSLVDTQLPDNNRGKRMGLAQQVLHTEMVNMQYLEGE